MDGDAATQFFQNVTVFDTIGLLGVVTGLGAYAALQFGFIIGRGYAYPALNTLASVLILISLIGQFHLATAISQLLWIAISTVGISRASSLTWANGGTSRPVRFSRNRANLSAIFTISHAVRRRWRVMVRC